MLIISTLWMGAIGFLDDYLKLTRGKDGLAAKWKLIGQVGLGIFVGAVMYLHKDVVVRVDEQTYKSYIAQASHTSRVVSHQCNRDTITTYYIKSTMTNAPFYKDGKLDYAGLLPMAWDKAKSWAWLIFIPFVILIVTSVSNAANLTDGIDGLAASVSAIVASTLVVLAYVSGHSFFADYLNILYIPWSGEIVVFTSAFIGACIGFLWYNTYPAQIFMGDTGSLTLGGIIAAIAIMIRKELLIPVLCGVFLAENLSVVLQVTYFKYTKRKFGEGRRIFLMSPLHHHFQKMGMHEAKIVSRFIIVSIMLAVITMITLKIR
jgi:phospho-N-acetylmuramoyl-pentapeptide-transferase